MLDVGYRFWGLPALSDTLKSCLRFGLLAELHVFHNGCCYSDRCVVIFGYILVYVVVMVLVFVLLLLMVVLLC